MMSENTSVTELVGLVENQKQSQKPTPTFVTACVFYYIIYNNITLINEHLTHFQCIFIDLVIKIEAYLFVNLFEK